MPTLTPQGEIDIFELLPPDEGEINIYYGRIGSGKTSAGTRNIIRALERGQIVYSNWNVTWEGYKEKEHWMPLILGALGLKKTYFEYPKENFHFWNFYTQELDGKKCGAFIDVLSGLTDCQIHLDEGHIPFDSYEATRMTEKKRSAVFATRHFDRSLTVYTQRANSVHINLRQNSNRFYKCEKLIDVNFLGKRWIRFQITEFQDLTSTGAVDETKILDENGNETDEYRHQIAQERYWGNKKLFAKFDSKYLRAGAGHSQPNYATYEEITWKENLKNIKEKIHRKSKQTSPQENKETSEERSDMGTSSRTISLGNEMDKNKSTCEHGVLLTGKCLSCDWKKKLNSQKNEKTESI